MRKLYVAYAVAAGMAVSAGWSGVAAQKIGYLYSEKILAEAPGAREVQQQLQQETQRLQSRLASMRDSLQQMVEEYQKQAVLLSPEEKKKREDAIRARDAAMQQRAQILQEESANRQEELMRPVMAKVEGVIEAVRKEGGYAIIFDASARVMVAADTTLDVTDLVIARLKASPPAGSGSPPSSKN